MGEALYPDKALPAAKAPNLRSDTSRGSWFRICIGAFCIASLPGERF